MRERVFLNPGEWFFGHGDVQVETLLGSCVAITVWSPTLKAGGMCHFLLPRHTRHKVKGVLDGRYGEDAVFWLKRQTNRLGLELQQCEVKLFGGSRVFAGPKSGAAIGEGNVLFAETALRELGVVPQCADVGGEGHRSLRFELATGDVWVRHTNTPPASMT